MVLPLDTIELLQRSNVRLYEKRPDPQSPVSQNKSRKTNYDRYSLIAQAVCVDSTTTQYLFYTAFHNFQSTSSSKHLVCISNALYSVENIIQLFNLDICSFTATLHITGLIPCVSCLPEDWFPLLSYGRRIILAHYPQLFEENVTIDMSNLNLQSNIAVIQQSSIVRFDQTSNEIVCSFATFQGTIY